MKRIFLSAVGALALSLAALTPLAAPAAAQQPQLSGYDRTLFIHGFNDTPCRWQTFYSSDCGFAKRVDAPDSIRKRNVSLKQVELPWLSSREVVATQASQLNSWFLSSGNHDVLVALSMGGVVSRYAYFNGAPAGSVRGIVTIASPHQGAPIAQALPSVHSYVRMMFRRMDSSILGFSIFGNVFVRYVAGTILGEIFIHYWLDDKLELRLGSGTPAMQDLRLDSRTILDYKDRADGLPHANVYGTVDRQYAWLRLIYASKFKDDEAENAVHNLKKTRNVLKSCEKIGWFMVVTIGVARACRAAGHTIDEFDDQWRSWTNGPDGKNADFDGFIPNVRQRYPGTALTSPGNFRAMGVNHMNIQYARAGTEQIAQAMRWIGMDRADLVRQVVIAPTAVNVYEGALSRPYAQFFNSSGDPVAGRTAVWSSDNPGIAQVASDGLITGIAAGTTTVRAMVDGAVGTVRVDVMTPPPLTAMISGPTTFSEAGTYSWTANPSGGIETYSYVWQYKDVGMQSWMDIGTGPVFSQRFSIAAPDFDLRVRVTSGSLTYTTSIRVDNTNPSSLTTGDDIP